MKNLILIPVFILFLLFFQESHAQTKESAILYVLSNHNHDKFKISLYLNNECLRKDKDYVSGDEFLELNKVMNVLLSKGWEVVASSEAVFGGYLYRTIFFERNKE